MCVCFPPNRFLLFFFSLDKQGHLIPTQDIHRLIGHLHLSAFEPSQSKSKEIAGRNAPKKPCNPTVY